MKVGRPRNRRLWRTPFGRWLSGYTVARLHRELERAGKGVTKNAPYNWIGGVASPRADRAVVMVKLSGNRISFRDVYRHRELVNKGRTNDGRGSAASVADGTTDRDRK